MQILNTEHPDFQKTWADIARRQPFDPEIDSQVAQINAEVARRGFARAEGSGVATESLGAGDIPFNIAEDSL